MIGRVFRTSALAGVLSLAALLAASDTLARGGGGGGAHGSATFGARSLSARMNAMRPPVHARTSGPMRHESPVALPSQQVERHARFGAPHRREGGFAWPLFYSGSFGYGPSYAPPFGYPEQSPYSDQFAYPAPAPYDEGDGYTGSIPGGVRLVVPYRPGCRTQRVTVPGEDDRELTINVVRC